MKPSILPPSTSTTECGKSCGPPSLTNVASWYGFWHRCSTGSGTHTFGVPSLFIGMPSAPGNVPK